MKFLLQLSRLSYLLLVTKSSLNYSKSKLSKGVKNRRKPNISGLVTYQLTHYLSSLIYENGPYLKTDHKPKGVDPGEIRALKMWDYLPFLPWKGLVWTLEWKTMNFGVWFNRSIAKNVVITEGNIGWKANNWWKISNFVRFSSNTALKMILRGGEWCLLLSIGFN